MPKIVIVPNLELPHSQVRQERRNVFSDETNLRLLRLLRGDSALPDTLGNTTTPQDLQLELAAAIRQRLLPWFWSIMLHTIVLILLAIKFFPNIRTEPFDVLSGLVHLPPSDLPIGIHPGQTEGDAPGVVHDDQSGAPVIDEALTTPHDEPTPSSPGLNFAGRDIDQRGTVLGGGGGGSGQTDEAVLAGLRWLAKVQQPNGAWHFSGQFFQNAPQRYEDPLAATAMALLAFQGYGVTPDSRHPQLIEFSLPVRRGWNWLRERQNSDGSFFMPSASSATNNHRFYTHGFCTIALCELLAMTSDESLREPAQRAIDYCVQHQSMRSGGWRYLPDRYSDQSDVSVTGWIVLALKTGQTAGLIVPLETYDGVTKFLDSMMKSNMYMYREAEPEPRITMTAEALYCRILLGWRRSNPRLAAGVRLILDIPPNFSEDYQRDVYYWFFATQTLYHYGGEEWQTWNSTMREQLLQCQENEGTESGSWNPQKPVRDMWGHLYGRHYTTCMSLYILEVYYRHLRIFP